MKGRVLKFEELKVGMKVCDEEGNPLIIKECDDIHNVFATYRGWGGFHCLMEDCTETVELEGYEPFENPQYSPLYQFIKEEKNGKT